MTNTARRDGSAQGMEAKHSERGEAETHNQRQIKPVPATGERRMIIKAYMTRRCSTSGPRVALPACRSHRQCHYVDRHPPVRHRVGQEGPQRGERPRDRRSRQPPAHQLTHPGGDIRRTDRHDRPRAPARSDVVPPDASITLECPALHRGS